MNKKESIPSVDSRPSVESEDMPNYPTYKVWIDREKLAKLDGIPDVMRDWLMRLPEHLHFKYPIILIVGENGIGKTTFARAIINSRAKALKVANKEARNFGLELNKDEPASALVDALTSSEVRRGENFRAIFIEGSEVTSEIRRWAKYEAQESKEYRAEQLSGGSYTHRLSSRQLFDQVIADLKKIQVTNNRHLFKHADIIFDEPEQGLSPERQLKLPQSISEFIEDTDTMLVPTNNLALYLSDLPRLDLSRPERGIYRPSDFGEVGKIILHGSTE